MSLGDRIRVLRTKKNLKQNDLARAVRVSPQAVSKWEKDANAPDIVQLVKLAALFGVSTDHLLGVHEKETGTFEATVFYSSLRGFAKQSTRMNAREVAEKANAVFHQLTEAVISQDGVPIKYVGDGFLCFFSGASHADRAAQAALRCRALVANGSLVVALHSGDVYLGTIGHREYSSRDILGETVNLVFLVTPWIARNVHGGIGATSSTAALFGKKFKTGKPRNVVLPLVRSRVPVSELK